MAIAGAMRILPDCLSDERGHFARTFCSREFAAQGLATHLVQSSTSFNLLRGTVRGLHFQWLPSREDKLVRCTRGHLLDVLLDIRPESASYLQHVSVELSAEASGAVYIPHGVAHGFQTLADATEVLYSMSDYYAPELADGLRWDDAVFGIRWPLPVCAISNADASRPAFDRQAYEAKYARQSLA
jgi:dTDP-4-dehydrorhamnose 3,5-epimerase